MLSPCMGPASQFILSSEVVTVLVQQSDGHSLAGKSKSQAPTEAQLTPQRFNWQLTVLVRPGLPCRRARRRPGQSRWPAGGRLVAVCSLSGSESAPSLTAPEAASTWQCGCWLQYPAAGARAPGRAHPCSQGARVTSESESEPP
jgi:hypothetical protein